MSSIEDKKAQLKALREARELKEKQLEQQQQQVQASIKLDEVERAVASTTNNNKNVVNEETKMNQAISSPSSSSSKLVSVSTQTEKFSITNLADEGETGLDENKKDEGTNDHDKSFKNKNSAKNEVDLRILMYDQSTQTNLSALLQASQQQQQQNNQQKQNTLENSISGASGEAPTTPRKRRQTPPNQQNAKRTNSSGKKSQKQQKQQHVKPLSLRQQMAQLMIDEEINEHRHQSSSSSSSSKKIKKPKRTLEQFSSILNDALTAASSSSSNIKGTFLKLIDTVEFRNYNNNNNNDINNPYNTNTADLTSISLSASETSLLLAASHSLNSISVYDVAIGKFIASSNNSNNNQQQTHQQQNQIMITKIKFISNDAEHHENEIDEAIATSTALAMNEHDDDQSETDQHTLVAGTTQGSLLVFDLRKIKKSLVKKNSTNANNDTGLSHDDVDGYDTGSSDSTFFHRLTCTHQSYPTVESHCEPITNIVQVPKLSSSSSSSNALASFGMSPSIGLSSSTKNNLIITFAGSTACSWRIEPIYVPLNNKHKNIATDETVIFSLLQQHTKFIFPVSSVALTDSSPENKLIRASCVDVLMFNPTGRTIENENTNDREGEDDDVDDDGDKKHQQGREASLSSSNANLNINPNNNNIFILQQQEPHVVVGTISCDTVVDQTLSNSTSNNIIKNNNHNKSINSTSSISSNLRYPLFYSKPISFFTELRGRRVEMKTICNLPKKLVVDSSSSATSFSDDAGAKNMSSIININSELLKSSSLVSVACCGDNTIVGGTFDGALVVAASQKGFGETGSGNNNNNDIDRTTFRVNSILVSSTTAKNVDSSSSSSSSPSSASLLIAQKNSSSSSMGSNNTESSSNSGNIIIASKWSASLNLLVVACTNGLIQIFSKTSSGSLQLKNSFNINNHPTSTTTTAESKSSLNDIGEKTSKTSSSLVPVDLDVVSVGGEIGVIAIGTSQGIVQIYVVA